MPVRVILVKCTQCGAPVQGDHADRVYVCGSCGTAHTRDDSGAKPLKYEIASPNPAAIAQGEPVYLPVWRLDSEVTINRARSEGGFLNKLFGKDWKGGRMMVFVPAIEWDPKSFKYWAQTLTTKPPQYTLAQGFGNHKRMALAISEEGAMQLADFLVLTFEAEQPGVLQDIDYTVKVHGTQLVYLPFLQTQAGFTIAL